MLLHAKATWRKCSENGKRLRHTMVSHICKAPRPSRILDRLILGMRRHNPLVTPLQIFPVVLSVKLPKSRNTETVTQDLVKCVQAQPMLLNNWVQYFLICVSHKLLTSHQLSVPYTNYCWYGVYWIYYRSLVLCNRFERKTRVCHIFCRCPLPTLANLPYFWFFNAGATPSIKFEFRWCLTKWVGEKALLTQVVTLQF